ncbi:MAG: helix-turn-helix transcriptional regulator [Thermomicrobiales bacterium]
MAIRPGLSSSQPPMIGRIRERVFLHEEVARSIGGKGRLVLIGGEAGIGKTTLARDAVHDAQQRNAIVLAGHCHDLTSSPPYAPWLDLAMGNPGSVELPPFPAAFAGGQLTEIQSQSSLFTEMLAFLTDIARMRPALVLLEDLHWSDSASLELLRFLSARIADLPILLLITYRVDELTRRHPLYQQLPGLIRAGIGLRLDLKRLESSAVIELIRSRHRLAIDDERRLATYLEQHAQGNPFYATELIRALEEAGELVDAGDGSELSALDRIVLPTLLTQVIDARVSRLGEAMRKPLSMAAVVGEDVSLDLWSEIAELSEDDLLAIVEDASEAHVLEANQDGTRVRFAHALIRDSLYESISPPRRLLWHRAIAEVLMRRGNPDPDAIAHHLTQLGDDRAPEWLVKAGNRAQRAYTWLIAADRFIAAAKALEAVPGSERERGWLLFRAARLLRLARPDRGLELLRESLRLANASGDELLHGDAHYSIGLLTIYTDRIGEGIVEMEAGIVELEALDSDSLRGDATVAIALADALPRHEAAADSDLESSFILQKTTGINHRTGSLSWWFAAAGRYEDAIAIGQIFLNATKVLDRPGGLVQSATAHCYHGLGYAHAAAGKTGEARDAFETARAIYRTLDHHGIIAMAYLAELRYVTLVYESDQPERRRLIADEAVAAIGQAGGAMPPGFPPNVARTPCYLLDGSWDDVQTVSSELQESGNGFYCRALSEAIAGISLYRGDYATAWNEITAFLPAGSDQQFGSRLFQETLCFQRLAAELATAEGNLEMAQDWLLAHDRWLSASTTVRGLAEGKLAWAIFHFAANDICLAIAEAHEALSFASEPRQPLTLLRANRLIGELEASRGQFTEAESPLANALDLAIICDVPYERALTLIALSELRCRQDRDIESAEFARQAADICTALRAEPALQRIAKIAPVAPESTASPLPFGLTNREIDVLKLVASGLTDAGVAGELFISPRTVGQHLRSIYNKLDVSSRAAATRVAIEHGIA